MKPKKMLSVFIAMIMTVMSISVGAAAEDADFVIDENGVLTEYNGDGGDVVIPDGVTAIGERAFYNRRRVYSIFIPAAVTSVSPSAFNEAYDLSDLIVSEDNGTYKSVDGVLFTKDGKTLVRCPLSTRSEYTVPDGVTVIEDHAFSCCFNLNSVTLPDSVTSIGESSFEHCITLTDITLPDSLTSIGESSFEFCRTLTDITLPDSLTSIGKNAFMACEVLAEIIIPDGITVIEAGTFQQCFNLKNVTLPSTVTSIGDAAFSNCTSLTRITIPESVTDIGFGAFGGCTNLTNIIIPESVTSIGRSAFDICEKVTVYCYENSAAHTYAAENSIPYEIIGEDPAPENGAGDADGDGKINILDVSLILRHIAKWDVTLNADAADVTADSNVNLSDVTLILKYIAKWDGIVLG